MGNYYIHVGSITNAMRGRRVLESQGIRSILQRASTPKDTEGCGYRLLVTVDPQRAVTILRDHGVRIVRVSEAL